jgi:hypothetical protein
MKKRIVTFCIALALAAVPTVAVAAVGWRNPYCAFYTPDDIQYWALMCWYDA